MAWTAKSDRFGSPTPADNVGPGTYTGHQAYEPPPSHAPFGSSTFHRTAHAGPTEKQVQSSTPAPGSYDPRLPKAYDSGLPAKATPFSSTVPRAGKPPAQTVPGPGAYSTVPKPMEAMPCRTMGFPQGSQKSVFRSSSAPSIPRDHQCYGYEEAGNGTLVRQGPKDGQNPLTGRPGDSAGPGQYDHRAEAVTRRAVGGQLARAPARAAYHDAKETPGPGHYVVQGPAPLATSSSFVSQVDRMSKKPPEQPGPGQYASDTLVRQDMRERFPELQYFGSTTERFGDRSMVLNQNPGPGSYSGLGRKQRAKSSLPTSDRFHYHQEKLPGPGHYEPAADSKTSGPLGTVSILGSTGSLAFGSMQSKRFIGKSDSAPGPGGYDINRDFEEASPADPGLRYPRRRQRMPTSVFKSEVPKDSLLKQAVREGQTVPPPGAYNPPGHIKDTNAVMHLPAKSEGFLSTEPRAARPKGAAAPGPGMYSTASITGGKRGGTFNRNIAEGTSSGIPAGMGFDAQARRWQKVSKSSPGPGAYDTGASWITKSHNVHFDASV